MIYADEKRLQALRHKAGQLDSVANFDLDELEALRMDQAQRLKELEASYYQREESQLVGEIIRRKIGNDDGLP